jgi:hypothetical protein
MDAKNLDTISKSSTDKIYDNLNDIDYTFNYMREKSKT